MKIVQRIFNRAWIVCAMPVFTAIAFVQTIRAGEAEEASVSQLKDMKGIEELKTAFNCAKDSMRLILLLSPT